ncbi:hypothetical protein C8J56DRAFT_1066955 [Mycena floridula]|nr:hypothetical protein C8J56DRAFT_1066955 [Mycena floridula]
MARAKLYHSAAERRAANALRNRQHHEKHKAKRNQHRRERHQENLLRQAARLAEQEKRGASRSKKAQGQGQEALSHPNQSSTPSDASSMVTTAPSTVLEDFHSFTCRNPRRFLQAVVSDYLETKHRPSLFATIADLQAIVNKFDTSSGSKDHDKAKESLLLIASWANEIRIEVTRSYDLTLKRFHSESFSFQLAHDHDGLGFTVDD